MNRVLSDNNISDFKRDGFVIMSGMFDTDMMKDIIKWTDEVATSPEVPGSYMMYFEQSLKEPGKRIVSRIEDFCRFHKQFDELINGPVMLGAVSELFGEPAVLFKDKINFKMPGGDGFKAHQDVQAGWDDYADLHITLMVTIDACTPENGCLELVAGHHNRGLVGKIWEPLTEKDTADMEFVSYATSPGDVAFFDSYAPHGSGPNMTDSARRVLYVTYNKLSEGDHRERYYADKRKTYPPDCERDPDKQYAFKV